MFILQAQIEALELGRLAVQRRALFQRRMQIDWTRIDRDLPRLDLGKIQHVIQQQHHRAPGFYDHFSMTALLFIQFTLQHQFGKPQDTVHRRADLVAHIGEEIRLCACRLLCVLACAGEEKFQFNPLRHIARGDYNPFARTGDRITGNRTVSFDEDRGACIIITLSAIGQPLLFRLARQQAIERILDPLARILICQSFQRNPNEVAGLASQHVCHGGGGIGAHPLTIEREHGIGDIVSQQGQFAPPLCQSFGQSVASRQNGRNRKTRQEVRCDKGLKQMQASRG